MLVDFAILIGCSLAIFFFRLGAVGLMDASETYFAEGTREMIENNNYLVPTVNYQMYFSKPALMFWLIASAYHVFGINEFAARFWSAVFAMLMVLMCYWTGRCLSGRTTGILAALICLSTPLIVTFARMSYTDMTYSSLLSIGVFALVMTLYVRSKKWWPVFYIALALSVLIKGPAGIVFLAAMVPIYLIMRYPSFQMVVRMLQALKPIAGGSIFLLITVPWFVAVGIATGGLWPKVFFVLDNFARFCGPTNLNVGKNAWWYYFTVLPYAFFPWFLFLPSAIKAAFSSAGATRARQYDQTDRTYKQSTSEVNGIMNVPDAESNLVRKQTIGSEALIMLTSYFIAVFIVLSISRTQMLYYILPSLAPAAVLVAWKMQQWIEFSQVNGTKLLRWLSLNSIVLSICGIMCLLFVAIALYMVPHFPLWVKMFGFIGALISAAGLTYQFVLLKAGKVNHMFFCLTCTVALAVACFCPIVFEIAYRSGQSGLVDIAKALSRFDGRIAIYNSNDIAPLFYIRRPLDCLFSPYLLVPTEATGDPVTAPQYVIVNVAYAHELTTRFGPRMHLIMSRGPWRAYKAAVLSARRYTPLEEVYRLGLWDLVQDKNKFGPLVNPICGGPYFHGRPVNGNLKNLEWKDLERKGSKPSI